MPTAGFILRTSGQQSPCWIFCWAVYYARPDGSAITEILHPLDTPNGIGLSPDGTRLYVAETLSAKVRYWDLTGPGQVQPPTADPFQVGHILYGFSRYERLDSLAVESEGNVVVATLGTGCVTAITPTGTVRAGAPGAGV